MHKIIVILLSEYFQSMEKILASLTQKKKKMIYIYVKYNHKNKNEKVTFLIVSTRLNFHYKIFKDSIIKVNFFFTS